MAITLTQNPAGVTASAATTNKAFASAPTVGNYILVAFGSFGNNNSIQPAVTSIVDNASGGTNSYTLLGSKDVSNASNDRAVIWLYWAKVVRTIAALTVTVTTTVTTGISLSIAEFAGIIASSPIDGTAVTGAATSTAVSSGALTPGGANRLFIGVMGYDGSSASVTLTTTGGWATLQITDVNDTNQALATAYLIATDSAAKTAAWTLGSSQKWGAIEGALIPAAATDTDPPFLLPRSAQPTRHYIPDIIMV